MEFTDLIKFRKSIRAFSNKKIDRTTMLEVLESGRLAPSACNYQPWRYIVVDDPMVMKQLQLAYTREWFATAPQVIVICGNTQESWKRPVDTKDHCETDIAIATDHITLMAAYKGLGTCWVCNFDPGKVTETLQLPDYLIPMVLLPIGYPHEPILIAEKNRRKIEEIVFHNDLSTKY